MSDSHAAALNTVARAAPRARLRPWPFDLTRQELLIDGLWIIFIVGTTTALTRIAAGFGIYQGERLFWLPGYLAVFLLVVPLLAEFLLLTRKNAIFMTWPLLACTSAIWSLAPGVSFYYGFQLFMTIMIGFLLFIHADLLRVLQIVFSALFLCCLLSLICVLLLPENSISLDGEWQGAFRHKNTLGNLMALQIITGLCLLRHGWRPMLCAAGVAFAAFLLLRSRSGTAIIALTAALAIIPPALAFRSGFKGFFAVLAAIAFTATAVAFVISELEIPIVQRLLSGLGKNETLTGRTILWDFAVEAIESRPWVGHGYGGYWASDETSAALLRYVMGQDLRFFHNTFLETAVEFGILGPSVFIAGLAFAFYAGLRAVVSTPGFIGFWPILFVTFLIVFSFGESPLFANHSIFQVLLTATIATPWRRMVLRRGVAQTVGIR